jgi:hypothetical protein
MQREFGDLQNLFCGPRSVLAWDLDSTCFYCKVLYVPTRHIGVMPKNDKTSFFKLLQKKVCWLDKKGPAHIWMT